MIEDVKILEWGESNGIIHRKTDTGLPEQTTVTKDFEPGTSIGKAKNFEKTEEGIKCDIQLNDQEVITQLEQGAELSVAPALEGETDGNKKMVNAEVKRLSVFGAPHANEELTGNLGDKF